MEIQGPMKIIQVPLYSEPLSFIVARAIAIAAVYSLVFNFILGYTLKRTQIEE